MNYRCSGDAAESQAFQVPEKRRDLRGTWDFSKTRSGTGQGHCNGMLRSSTPATAKEAVVGDPGYAQHDNPKSGEAEGSLKPEVARGRTLPWDSSLPVVAQNDNPKLCTIVRDVVSSRTGVEK